MHICTSCLNESAWRLNCAQSARPSGLLARPVPYRRYCGRTGPPGGRSGAHESRSHHYRLQRIAIYAAGEVRGEAQPEAAIQAAASALPHNPAEPPPTLSAAQSSASPAAATTPELPDGASPAASNAVSYPIAPGSPPGGAPASAPAPAPAPATTSARASPPARANPNGSSSDGFARAWTPPAGERPLWWVEKFEARRRAELARKAADPSFVTTQERVAAGGGAERNPAVQFLRGVGQVLQLVLVLSLLLLFPASLHDGGLSLPKPYTTWAAYAAFFGLGTLARMLRHGPLAPRAADRQVASWAGRAAFAVFVVLVPLLHMAAMYRYVGLALYTSAVSPYRTTLYDAVGAVGTLAAIALNVAASRELGPSYDRLAAPAALVTSGPYRFVQHPIYTSYMLLFVSYGMALHSAPIALALLAVCALYYRVRTGLEARVLEEAFGSHYRDYAARTGRFLPGLI